MSVSSKRQTLICITLILTLAALQSTLFINAQIIVPGTFKSGPYVDKIVFKVITQDDQQVLALLDDEIDLIGDFVNPIYLQTYFEPIDISYTPRNGYGYTIINCDRYPLNITDFRRAVAFAVDKYQISDVVWEGLSEPHDSFVPKINPFSIEGQLDYSYYASDIEYANYLLDRAGFE